MAATVAQTSLRMPEDLHRRLDEAANEAGHSLGEEIRQRLEASFQLEPDPKTRQLLALIAELANSMMLLDGIWHADLHLFQVFKVAVATLLSRFEPSGASPDAHYMMSRPDDPPETVGRMYAGFALRVVMNEKE